VKTDGAESSLEDLPKLRGFLEVFPEEIPDMPPLTEVEFCIDLTSSVTPIFKGPNRMAPVKLKEVNTQVDKLLEKGYI